MRGGSTCRVLSVSSVTGGGNRRSWWRPAARWWVVALPGWPGPLPSRTGSGRRGPRWPSHPPWCGWPPRCAGAGVNLIAALAPAGTLAVGEHLAGALIALMPATGRALDAAAERRASHDLRALLERAPRSARRRSGDDLVVVPLRGAGEAVRSGVVNAGGAVDVEATATAEDSTYAQQVVAAPGRTPSEVLRLAASLDQMSAPVLAEAIVAEARARGLALPPAREVTEEPGRGVTGTVDGRRVTVGKTVMPPEARPGWARAADSRAALDGAAVAWLTVDSASGP